MTMPRKFSHNPVMVRRACGGYLAVTPRNHPLSIGVTGDDKRETKMKYFRTLRSWLRILNERR